MVSSSRGASQPDGSLVVLKLLLETVEGFLATRAIETRCAARDEGILQPLHRRHQVHVDLMESGAP